MTRFIKSPDRIDFTPFGLTTFAILNLCITVLNYIDQKVFSRQKYSGFIAKDRLSRDNEENYNGEKIMWRWFRWVLLGIIIILLGFGAYAYWFYVYNIRMRPVDIRQAEQVFETGISISDPRSDPAKMENDPKNPKENNPNAYKVDFIDVKSMNVGADQNYLYFKINFYGTIPKKADQNNGDPIMNTGNKVEIMDQGGADRAIAVAGFGWTTSFLPPVIDTSCMYGATGIEWPEGARFLHQDKSGKVYGGAGYDYIMGMFPLDKLELKYGEMAYLSLSAETSSKNYGHASIDVLQGPGEGSKMPGFVTWRVGSNTYQINNEEHFFSGY